MMVIVTLQTLTIFNLYFPGTNVGGSNTGGAGSGSSYTSSYDQALYNAALYQTGATGGVSGGQNNKPAWKNYNKGSTGTGECLLATSMSWLLNRTLIFHNIRASICTI